MLAAGVHKITCEAFNIPMTYGKSCNIYNNWKSEIFLITLRLKITLWSELNTSQILKTA